MVDLLKRLIGAARNRDGRADALEPQALEREAAAAAAPAPAQRLRLATRPEAILQESLATKVLHGWLGNRQQTLYPLVLNLRNLNGHERALLAEVTAATVTAGRAPPAERGQAALQALARLGAGEEEARRFAAALDRPRPVQDMLAEVQDAGLGPHGYAASLLAADTREPASRAWLGYLAARFALPPEVVVSLDRRYWQ
jgi:uncharacterized membrane protein YebE (DUF533 family)